jgi:flagellar basal-body rod protein FlgG
MVRGIDIAASGMVNIINLNDILANNLANVNTPGFKQLIPTFRNIFDADVNVKAQGEQQSPSKIGTLSIGSLLDTTQLDFRQGSLKKTDGSLDAALNSRGFFAVQTKDGICYTRNGCFQISQDGELITLAGDKVLGGGGGSISIDLAGNSSSDVKIMADGRIMMKQEEVGKLKVVDFDDYSKLQMYGNTLFKPVNEEVKPKDLEKYTVTQGYLETSNSNIIESMINSITGNRTYESLSKVISATDNTLRKAVNDVGRV